LRRAPSRDGAGGRSRCGGELSICGVFCGGFGASESLRGGEGNGDGRDGGIVFTRF